MNEMRLKDCSILIADDDGFSASLIQRYLDQFGYRQTLLVEDGRAALAAMREDEVDLVLLDMQMPVMSGIDVLATMKADLELHDIPVIVISGEQELALVSRCIELGAEDYLTKPVAPSILSARLANALERRRLRRVELASVEALKEEKRRSDTLLDSILPPAAARELKLTGTVKARKFDDVVVMFADVSDFTKYCSDHPAEEVVGRLDALFGHYEKIAATYGLEKIKTVGDAFMAVASLNNPLADPLGAAVASGLEMMAVTDDVCPGWESRVGLAMGHLVAGIVGREKFQFDVWGDTVNVAARMVAAGRSGVVTMPQECWQRSGGRYAGRMLGEIEVKGKGHMRIVECSELKSPAV